MINLKSISKKLIETQDLSLVSKLKISELKKLLDFLYRKKLLLRMESRGGKFLCPLTNKYYPISKAQVCHFIDRANLNLRWDDDNCVMCSEKSNYWDSQKHSYTSRSIHHEDFEIYLGNEKVKDLLNRSLERKSFTRYDYISVLENIIKQLKLLNASN